MNDHTEALLDTPDQFGRVQRRIFLTDLLKKVHDLAGELVRLLGSALVWHKASYAPLLECELGLIERWTREAKRRGRFGDRTAFFLDTTEHLVLDLNYIPRIEELAALE